MIFLQRLSASQLDKLLTTGVSGKEVGKLSLTEWLSWQRRFQTTDKVSHSEATKDLVEMMEFMDVQSESKETVQPYPASLLFLFILNRSDATINQRRSGSFT